MPSIIPPPKPPPLLQPLGNCSYYLRYMPLLHFQNPSFHLLPSLYQTTCHPSFLPRNLLLFWNLRAIVAIIYGICLCCISRTHHSTSSHHCTKQHAIHHSSPETSSSSGT